MAQPRHPLQLMLDLLHTLLLALELLELALAVEVEELRIMALLEEVVEEVDLQLEEVVESL